MRFGWGMVGLFFIFVRIRRIPHTPHALLYVYYMYVRHARDATHTSPPVRSCSGGHEIATLIVMIWAGLAYWSRHIRPFLCGLQAIALIVVCVMMECLLYVRGAAVLIAGCLPICVSSFRSSTYGGVLVLI